jgi:superfamily II DNA or RNA helicase/transposase
VPQRRTKILSNALNRRLSSCRSWDEVRRVADSLPNKKEQGDLFEALVCHYLRLDPVYQSLLDDVWLLRDVPAEVRAALDLRGDIGIDLVCKTREGKYWAVQAKYRTDPQQALSWKKDLSTFAGLVAGRPFEQALVATTTIDVGDRAKQGLKGNFTSLKADVWTKLDVEFFREMAAALAGRKVIRPPRLPKGKYAYQGVAREDVVRAFANQDRAKLLMACGTGKTLTAFFIAEAVGAKKILVAVPNLGLARQILREWMQEYSARGIRPRAMVVCSDSKVADDEDLETEVDDSGIHVTTDVEEAKTFFRKDGEYFVVTTYHSGETTAQAAREAGVVFDLGLFDEAHKTVGEVGRTWSHLLFEKNIRISKRLFMTATERVFRNTADDVELVDMDDVEHYGQTAHSLTFLQALEKKLLCDYRVITLETTTTEAKRLLADRRIVLPKDLKLNQAVRVEMLASALGLLDAMKVQGVRHVITYHSSVSRANAFEKLTAALRSLPKYSGLTLSSFHLNGSDPAAKRDFVMSMALAAPYSMVTNCRCLTEGIDVPAIDGVAFIDAKQSAVDIVQAVGRALRTSQGKNFGYVFVPAILRPNQDLDDLKNGPYAATASVITKMGTMDADIVEMVEAISQGKVPSGPRPVPFKLPVGLDIDAEAFGRGLALRIHSRLVPHRLDYELIARLIREGFGNKEITAQAKCSGAPVVRVRQQLGIPDPKYVDQKKLESLIREGLRDGPIMNEMGCTRTAVSLARRRLGIPSRPKVEHALMDRLLRDGWRTADVAERVGCSIALVIQRRGKLRLQPPGRRDRALIDKLIKQGLGTTQIAERAECSPTLVTERRRLLGIPAPTFVDYSQMEKLVRAGKSNREVMTEADCSESVVAALRRKLGIPAPHFKDRDTIRRMIRAGQGNPEIVSSTGAGTSLIALLRRELGIRGKRARKGGGPSLNAHRK